MNIGNRKGQDREQGKVQKTSSSGEERITEQKITKSSLEKLYRAQTPIVMLTAYDYLTAKIFDRASVDCLLVGDSLGNVMLGHGSTIPTTLEEILIAARSVSRGAQRAFVIADLPFGTYESSPAQAFANASRLIKEAGVQAVKIEGGRRVAEQVRLLTQSGIPVVGHLGFTPQSVNQFGGHKVQGRSQEQADRILEDAHALVDAGAFMLVLEMLPADIAERLTKELPIPTIGIGAGKQCSGQVLVWSDMAGMDTWRPKFAKVFAEVGNLLMQATLDYSTQVREGEFPQAEHTFH